VRAIYHVHLRIVLIVRSYFYSKAGIQGVAAMPRLVVVPSQAGKTCFSGNRKVQACLGGTLVEFPSSEIILQKARQTVKELMAISQKSNQRVEETEMAIKTASLVRGLEAEWTG
jgi:hypothetical protein